MTITMGAKVKRSVLPFLAAALLAAFVALAGCAGMSDSFDTAAGLGVVSQSKSSFDGSRTVEVSPTWLFGGMKGPPNSFKMGARWSSAYPKDVAVIIAYNSTTSGSGPVYVNIEELDVNVNGHKASFRSAKMTHFTSGEYNDVIGGISTESRNIVIVPLRLLDKMAKASDCRVRISTIDNYEDSVFSIGRNNYGQKGAVVAIRAFLARVHQVESAR